MTRPTVINSDIIRLRSRDQNSGVADWIPHVHNPSATVGPVDIRACGRDCLAGSRQLR